MAGYSVSVGIGETDNQNCLMTAIGHVWKNSKSSLDIFMVVKLFVEVSKSTDHVLRDGLNRWMSF